MCEFEPIEDYELRIGSKADEYFRTGQEYLPGEIGEFAKKHNSIFSNTTAHTYNRWNTGMKHGKPRLEQILPLFEYENRKYVFIGSRLSEAGKNYSGEVWHHPNNGNAYQIGEWKDGCFQWIKGQEL